MGEPLAVLAILWRTDTAASTALRGMIFREECYCPTLGDWKEMFRSLWRIRVFEGQVQRLAAAGEVPGFPHLSTGQEAVAVGVCAHLTAADALLPATADTDIRSPRVATCRLPLPRSSAGIVVCAVVAGARCISSMRLGECSALPA